MAIERIDDPDDPRLAEYRNVPDPELLERRGAFVAEGRLVVRRLLTSRRFVARSLLVTETALTTVADLLDTDLPDKAAPPTYVVSPALMNRVAGFNVHRGCLAIGERPLAEDWRRLTASARRVVALEGVGNADNVGAVFRHAAAFAVDAVILGPGCADPLYRKAIRTSMSAVLSIPFAHDEEWPLSLRAMRESGHAVWAMTPAAGSTPVRDAARDASGRPIVIVAGHEGDGLTAEAMRECSHRVRIPIAADVDSINVATAVAIALYEIGSGA